MNTIEEEKYMANPYCPLTNTRKAVAFNEGFEAGTEFAQRWITVEEEDAPLGLLLMRLQNGEIRLGYFTDKMITSSGILHG